MDATEAPLAASHAPRRPLSAAASVTAWLGVLFALLLLLIAVGGYVRLSGSGVSIPDWPLIRIGDQWSLLPPASEAGWLAVRERFDAEQTQLKHKQSAGVLGLGSLGSVAHDMPTFKRLFMTEWCHRFVAALVAVVAIGALAVTFRHPAVRQRIGVSLGSACALIVFQAVLGGILVKSGTATNWLFFHLGVAALILALVVWSILRLLSASEQTQPGRIAVRRWLQAALALVWIQLMLGALVAGSRITGHVGEGAGDFVSEWPLMHQRLVPAFLWDETRPLAWNLLDNALLHQWVHRWFAWLGVAAELVAWWVSRRARPGLRLRLAMQVSMTFLGVQALLGIANVVLATPLLVSLAHLMMAMFLITALLLALHDAYFETAEAA